MAALTSGKLTAASPPETSAQTHGLHRWLERSLAPACSRCVARPDCEAFREGGTCALAERAQADLVAQVMELPHVRPEDYRLAREFAKTAVALDIVDAYVGATSPFLPGAEAGFVELQPVMRDRARLSAQLRALAGDLGLSPAARARLRVSGRILHPLHQAVLDAEKERAAAVDAEFTTTDSDTPEARMAGLGRDSTDGAPDDAPEGPDASQAVLGARDDGLCAGDEDKEGGAD